MGSISRHNPYYPVLLLVGLCLAAVPLACSSPIPSHITLRTGVQATSTYTPAPVVEPAKTEAAAASASPTVRPASTNTPAPTAPFTQTAVLSAPVAPPTVPLPTRTPTLTPSPTSSFPQGGIYYDEEAGFAIALPRQWMTAKEGMRTYMAITREVWGSRFPNDPLLILVAGPLDEIFEGALARADTPDDVLMVAAGVLGRDWRLKVTSIAETTLEGYPAVRGVVEDADPGRAPQLVGSVVATLLDGRALTIWALTPFDQWEEFEPTYQAMMSSLTLTEPVRRAQAEETVVQVPMSQAATATPTIRRPPAVDSRLTPATRATATATKLTFPAVEDPYTNDVENYSLLVPKGWRVMIEDGTFTIAPTVDDFSAPVLEVPMVEVTVGSLAVLYDGAASGADGPGPLLDAALKIQLERGINALGSPRSIQVDGHPAALVDLSGAGFRGQLLSVHLGGSRAALMGVLAPESQWDSFAPVFQAMVTSLQFGIS